MLVKPSVGKDVISFAVVHSPTHDGSGLFLGASVDHQHPTEGQGFNFFWLVLWSQGDHPHGLSLHATWRAALEPEAFTSRPPNQPLVGVSQCKDSISRLGCLWSLLLRLDNEGHGWEGLWPGCPCTKGSSPMPGHPGTVVYNNKRKKPRVQPPPRLHRLWLFTLALSQEFGISALCYI